MVRTTTDDATVLTGHRYKDPDTCGLYKSGHRIAAAFDDTLQAFIAAFDDVNADVVAGGCNGCTTVDDDVDVWANYVAQGTHDTDTLYVGFGARDDADYDAEDVAEALIVAAAKNGVPVSWNGDTGKKVCLGDANAYDD